MGVIIVSVFIGVWLSVAGYVSYRHLKNELKDMEEK